MVGTENYDPDTPLVTVIVVSHDRDAKYLPRAFASLRKQTLDPRFMDVILAFDGTPSTDSEASIMEAANECPFPIHFMYHPEKTGYYTVPRNRAIPVARGLYISNMDADNEFAPGHLAGLLTAIRTPHETEGWPHFVYSRREIVSDGDTPAKLIQGPTPLVPWTRPNVVRLCQSPQNNFVDTGDFLVGKATLYELAERTGFIWNSEMRRFGDWEIIRRMAGVGFRGRAVDQVTNIYHCHGGNISLTAMSDLMVIPVSAYEALKAEGKVRE